MRWEGRRKSTNVEDRRGRSGGIGRRGRVRLPLPRGRTRKAGGGSIVLVIAIVVGLWLFAGINPLQLVDMLARQDGGGGALVTAPSEPMTAAQKAAEDEKVAFLSVVLAETEDTWGRIFRANGAQYRPTTLAIYRGGTPTECGFGNAAAGPFYCPADQRVYIDVSFFDLLSRRLGAGGDFAQAYVLAHEVGHHVQNLTGVLGEFNRERRSMSERAANAMSVRIELQADCYAGVWAHAVGRAGLLEEGDLEEAINAAAAVGDDMMQRRTAGHVVPDSFTHGTSEQRVRWFRAGYRDGDPGNCDTFAARTL